MVSAAHVRDDGPMTTRTRMPLQARLVAWVLLSASAILAATLLVSQLVLRDRAADRVAQELRGEVAELRLLADEGLDPATGEPFTDASALLQLHVGSSLPDPGESMFAVVDGQVVARSDDVPTVRLDRDPEFLELVSSATSTEYGTHRTGAATIRYAIVPVTATGHSGAFVVTVADSAETDAIRAAGWLTLAVAAALLIPAAIATWLVAGRALTPLRAMRRTAQDISESDLTGRITPRHAVDSPAWDELDDLAVTFNDMLDRLGTAFEAQRRFVDDAGHELRTPLTVVRGHLELIDDDPAGRAETLALVDDELARMGRLVADLQTLTKSTQPSFLDRGPVNVADLIEEVLSRARFLGDRTWLLDGTAEEVIQADRHRLVQALMALVSNAVDHTQPGDVLALGSARVGTEVLLWVRDTGSGVPPGARDRLFDRFAREEGSEGTGLGLSIVAAIALAHGGRAVLLDPGPGSTRFALVLPAGPAGGQAEGRASADDQLVGAGPSAHGAERAEDPT